jgi:cytochrome c-type biogenesis protein
VTEWAAGGGMAFWLGILTAISPCPLATNIAAVSFIGRDAGRTGHVLASGAAYALGRVLAYVVLAVLIVTSILSIPGVAWFLQTRMSQILGPLLIVIGVFVLGWIRIPLPATRFGEALQRRAAGAGVLGAGFLGMLFALSFCPISAGLFFGSLVPLAVSARSPVVLPAIFGIGTGLPVVAFAVMIALGARGVGRAFDLMTRVERWARIVTGITILAIGVYFVITQNIGIMF